MSIKALIVFELAKEEPGTSLRISTVCNFQTMKSFAELNRLLLKFLLLCQMDNQESSRKSIVEFSFLELI